MTIVNRRVLARAAGFALSGVVASLVPGIAGADVYKCAGDGGVPVYQEMPCPPGKSLRDFQADPPDITVLPGTNGAAGARKAGARPPAERPPAREGKAPRPGGDAAERKHLRIGMTAGEVRLRVGSPETTTGGKGGKPERWTWLPAAGDPDTITTVTLSNGVVTDVDRRVVKR